MFQINVKKKRWLFVTTILINDLTKCVTSKRLPTLTWFFTAGNLSDQLENRCHKITRILFFQSFCIYQSCEQVDFNGSNKLLHLIGPIIEQRWQLYQQKFSFIVGFSLLGLKVFFSSSLKNSPCVTFVVFMYNDFLTLYTWLLYFSYIILFVLHISFQTTFRLAEPIVQLSIQILKMSRKKI